VLELLRTYFGLSERVWGKDANGGAYPWLTPRRDPRGEQEPGNRC
jgi:hypothetical protein